MSEERHPNFHAVKFTTTITSTFFESLRGKATAKTLSKKSLESIKNKIAEFVSEIENIVDREC